HVAAVSAGLWQGEAVLDLDYAEDSAAGVDANFVLTDAGGIVEIQATAEATPFTGAQFDGLLALARHGTEELFAAQRQAIAEGAPA
ncbi:MAG: ribonuclease PH, partial [Roseomonas mucosa]|nr:ribonuclease PH [Roseomonas mucosa]